MAERRPAEDPDLGDERGADPEGRTEQAPSGESAPPDPADAADGAAPGDAARAWASGLWPVDRGDP